MGNETTALAALAGPGCDLTAAARQAMTEMVRTLDARFTPAGQTLAQLVETTGTVLGGIESIESVLGANGQDSPAARALTRAAQDLRDAPVQQQARSARIGDLAGQMDRLGELSGGIARVLKVLQFYTVNLKIAAAGADEFVEFANDMSLKLAAGRNDVAALDGQIAQMTAGLSEMGAIDRALARECTRIIPQVPDKLEGQVHALRQQQGALERRTAETRAIVLRLQGNVGAAIGAMQVSDITRQRIEHVRDGCLALEGALERALPQDVDATRGHMLRLLGDQLDDLSREFSSQTGQLGQALTQLAPDCQRLLDQGQRGTAGQGDTGFLRALGDCIADAHDMSTQLHRANGKALEMAEVIVQVVGSLRERVRSVEDLRYEVDYMAINVNLRARRDPIIGRPVAVIANEIRICSCQLAELIDGVTAIAEALGRQSLAFETGSAGSDGSAIGHSLEGALGLVTQAVQDSDAAVAELEVRAQRVAAMINDAREELAGCDELAQSLRAMADSFTGLADGLPAVEHAGEGHPTHDLMATLARSYTMSSERTVHNRHLLPGMAGPAAPTRPELAAVPFDDDDALFDDALF